MSLAALRQLSVVKTLRINKRYFGWGGVMKPRILCSKHVRLVNVRGSVSCPDKIGTVHLGFGHVGIVDEKTRPTVWEVQGDVNFGGFARFGPGSRIVVGEGGVLSCGDGFLITADSSIIANKSISFGVDALVSWGCLFLDSDMHSISRKKDGCRINDDRKIVIGDHVWIGCNVVILKGSVVPDGCVIAAGSTVSGRLESRDTVYSSRTPLKADIVWSH